MIIVTGVIGYSSFFGNVSHHVCQLLFRLILFWPHCLAANFLYFLWYVLLLCFVLNLSFDISSLFVFHECSVCCCCRFVPNLSFDMSFIVEAHRVGFPFLVVFLQLNRSFGAICGIEGFWTANAVASVGWLALWCHRLH